MFATLSFASYRSTPTRLCSYACPRDSQGRAKDQRAGLDAVLSSHPAPMSGPCKALFPLFWGGQPWEGVALLLASALGGHRWMGIGMARRKVTSSLPVKGSLSKWILCYASLLRRGSSRAKGRVRWPWGSLQASHEWLLCSNSKRYQSQAREWAKPGALQLCIIFIFFSMKVWAHIANIPFPVGHTESLSGPPLRQQDFWHPSPT